MQPTLRTIHSPRPTPSADAPAGIAPAHTTPGMPGAPTAPALRLHVDRLVLDGFALPANGEAEVRAAFESELGRLLGAGELPARLQAGGARRDLPGEITIQSWTSPEDLGRQIARVIYEGLGR